VSQLINSADLKKIAEDLEMQKRKEEAAVRLNADKVAEDLKKEFEAREISPQAPDRINIAVRAAVERGEHEVLVLRFPATFCRDGGRSINNFEPDWPESLTGFAKTAFEFYANELRPLGYTLRAEIMNFPGGMPGDVGLYLRW
jgi:hypothetical protein